MSTKILNLQSNKSPISFNDAIANSYRVLEGSYPEIAQSLKQDGRGKGLQTMIEVWQKLSKGATSKHVKELDPTTEARRLEFLAEKRRLYKETARNKTIIDPTMESLLPAEISTSLKALGISTKIPIDPKNGRLIAPIEDEITYKTKTYKTFYPNTGNPKYLSNNLLSGILMTVPPWNSGGTLATTSHLQRIPEVQLLRAYIKYGKTPAFTHAMMKIIKKRNDLNNPKVLARRIVSKFKRKGFDFKEGNPSIIDNPLNKKYLMTSDESNLRNLVETLKKENLNAADETNWKKYGGFYKDLMLKGKLKKSVKDELAKKVQLFSKEAADAFYVL